jgi:hypothetical protein
LGKFHPPFQKYTPSIIFELFPIEFGYFMYKKRILVAGKNCKIGIVKNANLGSLEDKVVGK